MKKLRLLFLPFSWLYGAILFLRHFFYDRGIFTSYTFKKPVIVIGNLVLGGAGKSPMTEYLLRLLSVHAVVATLSRGYGRKSKGYLEVQPDSSAKMAGDEPLQFKRKFPAVTVADCEDRVVGLNILMPNHDLIILDDAFQHRSVQPGLSILLFDFESLYENKFVLPAGNYRDLFMRRNAADIIVVTKSPKELRAADKQRATALLRLKKKLPLFFSYIDYGELIRLVDGNKEPFPKDAKLIVLTGIANPKPFYAYLGNQGHILSAMRFPDHHSYTLRDLARIKEKWQSLSDSIIITTEKDAMRLKNPDFVPQLSGLPLYYIPIEMKIHRALDGPHFDDLIKEKVLKRISK